MHGGAAAEFGVDDFFAELELLARHLRFARPVAAELRQVVGSVAEVEHRGGVGRELDGLLLLMTDFAPGLDDVFLRVGHVVERYVDGVFVVFQIDGGFRAAGYRFGARRNVVEVGGGVAVGVRNAQSRLKVVLIARAAVHFPAAFGDAAVRAGMYGPVHLAEFLFVAQLVAQVSLIETSVVTYLQY